MVVVDAPQTYGPDDGGPPMGITWTVEPVPRTRWWHARGERLTVEWNSASGRRTDSIVVPPGFGKILAAETLGAAKFGTQPNLDLQYQTLITI